MLAEQFSQLRNETYGVGFNLQIINLDEGPIGSAALEALENQSNKRPLGLWRRPTRFTMLKARTMEQPDLPCSKSLKKQLNKRVITQRLHQGYEHIKI